MTVLPPDLRRTWLFGPGADAAAREAVWACRLLARAQRLAQWHGGAPALSTERRHTDGH